MKLQEIFDALAYGELSNVSFGKRTDEGKGITEASYPQVLSSINLGLVDLHSRFPLKTGEIIVDLAPGRVSYILAPTYQVAAVGNGTLEKYIRFDGTKFKQELLKIEQVRDSNQCELGLNDGVSDWSVSTPSYNTLVVPSHVYDSLAYKHLHIQYRKSVPPIVMAEGYFDPATTEVDLPYTHLQALLYFVASRAHNPVGFNEQVHEGNNYASKYENACAMLNALNLRVDVVERNDRLRRGGWV